MNAWIQHCLHRYNLRLKLAALYLRPRRDQMTRIFFSWRIFSKVLHAVSICFDLTQASANMLSLVKFFYAWDKVILDSTCNGSKHLLSNMVTKKQSCSLKSTAIFAWKQCTIHKNQIIMTSCSVSLKRNLGRVAKIFLIWSQIKLNESSVLFIKEHLKLRKISGACLCKWMEVVCRSKDLNTVQKNIIRRFLRHRWITWKVNWKQAKRKTELILLAKAASSGSNSDPHKKQAVQAINRLKILISRSRYVEKTVCHVEKRRLLTNHKKHWLAWTQVALYMKKLRLLTFICIKRKSQSQQFRVFMCWKTTGLCSVSKLKVVESRVCCGASVTKIRCFWRWNTNIKNKKIIRSQDSISNLESDVSNMKTILGGQSNESKYMDWDSTASTWTRVKDDKLPQAEQLKMNCRSSLKQESVSFERNGSTSIHDVGGQNFLPQAPVIRSLKFENPSDDRYESPMKVGCEHQYFESEIRDFGGVGERGSAINPRQQQNRNVDVRVENRQQLCLLAGLKQQDEITTIENERNQLTAEITQLRMKMETMIPRSSFMDLKEENLNLSLEIKSLKQSPCHLHFQDKKLEHQILEIIQEEKIHHSVEIDHLKSSSENIVPKLHTRQLEMELNWLFQEIKRIQLVVDLDIIRSLPEPIQLERCFVSTEVCSSFCVRALIRLGHLLKKQPQPDRSHGVEFCLFDASVYD